MYIFVVLNRERIELFYSLGKYKFENQILDEKKSFLKAN